MWGEGKRMENLTTNTMKNNNSVKPVTKARYLLGTKLGVHSAGIKISDVVDRAVYSVTEDMLPYLKAGKYMRNLGPLQELVKGDRDLYKEGNREYYIKYDRLTEHIKLKGNESVVIVNPAVNVVIIEGIEVLDKLIIPDSDNKKILFQGKAINNIVCNGATELEFENNTRDIQHITVDQELMNTVSKLRLLEDIIVQVKELNENTKVKQHKGSYIDMVILAIEASVFDITNLISFDVYEIVELKVNKIVNLHKLFKDVAYMKDDVPFCNIYITDTNNAFMNALGELFTNKRNDVEGIPDTEVELFHVCTSNYEGTWFMRDACCEDGVSDDSELCYYEVDGVLYSMYVSKRHGVADISICVKTI